MNPTRLASAIQGLCDGCGECGNVLQVVAITSPTRTIRLCPDCIDFAHVVCDRELNKEDHT